MVGWADDWVIGVILPQEAEMYTGCLEGEFAGIAKCCLRFANGEEYRLRDARVLLVKLKSTPLLLRNVL